MATVIPRASDGKLVTEYRNGNREVKQAVIDTLVLQILGFPGAVQVVFNPLSCHGSNEMQESLPGLPVNCM